MIIHCVLQLPIVDDEHPSQQLQLFDCRFSKNCDDLVDLPLQRVPQADRQAEIQYAH